MKETIPISASMSTKHRHDPNASQLIMAKATGATETLLMNSEVSGDGRPYHGTQEEPHHQSRFSRGMNSRIKQGKIG